MGTILAVAIFVFMLRFFSAHGTTPLWSLGIAALTTIVVYPVTVSYLDGFLTALSSNAVAMSLGLLIIAGGVSFGGYLFGRRSASKDGSPFKPF